MLFTSVTVLSLFSLSIGTLAAPLSSRSAAVPNIFETCTSRVNYELDQLTKQLNAILRERPNDRSQAAQRITEAAGHVVHASKDGAATMRSAQTATFAEATALVGPITTLTSATDQTAKQWIRIKDIVFQMNGQQKVIGLLKNMKDAGAEFTLAMNSKMPAGYKQAGQLYGNAVDKMVADVIREYQTGSRGPPGPGWY